jgi:poly(A) polymerase
VTGAAGDGATDIRLPDATWLHDGPLAALLAQLDREDEEARAIGGAVRNALLGEPIGDIDVATTAVPDEVIRRVTAAGWKAVPTGIEHGTVTVIIDGTPFEVTTLREDVETFGRRATVRFGRDWRRDAERRDFTINAFSVTRQGVVYDYVGGLADLEARRIRFVGDAATRIAEDYLRILRLFRFHAAYGEGAPDADGFHAAIIAHDGLTQLSRERVRMELIKLLVARHAAPVVEMMSEAGLLGTLIGGVVQIVSLARMIEVETTLSIAADPIRRLGALGVLVTEDAERLGERLRLARAEQDRLASMADQWWRVAPVNGEAAARALLYRLGPERFIDRVLLAWTRMPQASAADWGALVALPKHWQAPPVPFKAVDFMALGVPKGPRLGIALRAAEEAWIAADFPTDDAALARIAEAAIGG